MSESAVGGRSLFILIGFLMVVGPGEAQIATDTLFHCLRLYPDSYTFIRDDATSDGSFQVLAQFAAQHASRISLERNSHPEGYLGIARSTFQAYASAWDRHPDIEMMIALDPDTCVLRLGLAELARRKFAQFGPGIIGAYKVSAYGGKRGHGPHRLSIIRDLVPVGTDQRTKRRRVGFPFYLKYLPNALRHGYKLGENILAAFYIMHGNTFRELGRRGFWHSMPAEGSCYLKMDDPLVSLGVKSIGHSLIEINDPKHDEAAVWLQYRAPVRLSAEEIVRNAYLAVHPLKHTEEGLKLRKKIRILLNEEEGELAV